MAPTWSNFVRFRPAALSIDASKMIASPMMNATTGFAWCAGTLAVESASFAISFVNSATAAVRVDVVSMGF